MTTEDTPTWESQQTDRKLKMLAAHGNEPGRSRAQAEIDARQRVATAEARELGDEELAAVAEHGENEIDRDAALAELDRRATGQSIADSVQEAVDTEGRADIVNRALQQTDAEALETAQVAAQVGEVVDASEGPQEADESAGTEVVQVATEMVNRVTGETVMLADASPQDLVGAHVAMGKLIGEINVERGHAEDELRRRMDSATEWTMHETVDGEPFKISAPSPDAGTTHFHADELEPVLLQLIADKVITEKAAEAGMTRTLTLTFKVPLSTDPALLAVELKRGELDYLLGGELVHLKDATSDRKAHKPGLTKLRKIKAAKAAIDAVEHERLDPTRRVTIKSED